MSTNTALEVDLRQMIIAIETAVSLVGMNDTNHGKRVGYIACQLGHQLGFSDQDAQFAFELGLLHDAGVSTEQMHTNITNHFDWKDAYIHCEIGYGLLKGFDPLARFANPVLFHHTPWNQLENTDISKQDARFANLIFLADRIDVLSGHYHKTDILLGKSDIARTIEKYSGTYFKADYVEAFRELSSTEAFWILLEDRHITRFVWDMGQRASNGTLTLPQLRQLSLILSYIVDQKSPFTAKHSVRVADLAKYLASLYGLSEEQCEKVEIAGLLHDLGKLHIPDAILEKPGPLNDLERAIMNRHSFETYEILRHIKGLKEIATWASYHHEGLNGAGYPFHPDRRNFCTEARIIAVADVFQALVQDRPYRDGMELEDVIEILDAQADEGKLDDTIVDLAKTYANQCFDIAKGDDELRNQPYLNLLNRSTSITQSLN